MNRAERALFVAGYLLLIIVVAVSAYQVGRALDQARTDRCAMFEVQVAVSLVGLSRSNGETDALALDRVKAALNDILAPVAQSCPDLN